MYPHIMDTADAVESMTGGAEAKAEKITEYSTHSEPHRPALRATYSII